MMPNQSNQPSGLYLHLGPGNSEPWERDCSWADCNGTGRISMSILNPNWYPESSEPCSVCHGTGKRRVRLVGAVEVAFGSTVIQVMGADYIGDDTFKGSKRICANIVADIITAYRTGTLPPEVAKGLREVDAQC